MIKTEPLDDEMLRPLLTACLHLVDVLGPHIVDLWTELQAEREARRKVEWSRNLRDADKLAALVDAHLRTGQPLPRLEDSQVTKRLRSGWNPKDPLLDANFQHLLRPTGHRDIGKALLIQARPLLEEAVAEVGTEYVWCRKPAEVPRADTGEMIPWSLPLSNKGADALIRVAGHACKVATSALTGMRSSELMELTVGCRRTDDADGTGLARHRLVSKVVKGRTVEAYRQFEQGQLPVGPGADALLAAFRAVEDELTDHEPGPAKVVTDRQIELLLKKKASVLHLSAANYCWFEDPAKALCLKLAGAKSTAAPLAGLCDSSRCPQATHHLVHRSVWHAAANNGAVLLASPRIPAGEKERMRAEHERSMRVLQEIDKAAGKAG
ncbi:hypothetical protein [Kitasatospora sp. GP82]|uniref:hypothetical protein n=1 Tax=Kitasatospora sp. GP82 TaxID=3035089 RepID=UPI002475DDDC|nr:hypothetical protein [Kitasatospora sp. GP82]